MDSRGRWNLTSPRKFSAGPKCIHPPHLRLLATSHDFCIALETPGLTRESGGTVCHYPRMTQQQCITSLVRGLSHRPWRLSGIRCPYESSRNYGRAARRDTAAILKPSSQTGVTWCRPYSRHLWSPPRIRTQPRPQLRSLTTTPSRQHGDITPPKPGEERKVTFIDKEQQQHTFEVADGDNLLDIAQANDLEMEGACGGSCACSTCHVIVQDDEMYDKIEEPSDDENDMLDLAFGLTETSRLGCQVQMSKALDGLVVSCGLACFSVLDG